MFVAAKAPVLHPERHFSPEDIKSMEAQLAAFRALPVIGRKAFLEVFMVGLLSPGLTEAQRISRKTVSSLICSAVKFCLSR